MNPRILKKLSNRVAGWCRWAQPYTHDEKFDCLRDYDLRHASRKRSHMEPPYKHDRPYSDGKPSVGAVIILKGTKGLGWTSSGPDGSDWEGAIAWPFLEGRTMECIDWDARDTTKAWDDEGYPPYKDGPPKKPRNTWEKIRAIQRYCEANK